MMGYKTYLVYKFKANHKLIELRPVDDCQIIRMDILKVTGTD